MRIVIVEDNKTLADGVAKAFKSDGHGVDVFWDGTAALPFLRSEKIDLIVMDINLPNHSGLEVLQALRAGGNTTPVLMVTARDSIDEKVAGLDLGADDYMTKPFELAELLARSRALLRRGKTDIVKTIDVGALSFDQIGRHICVDGNALELPRREFSLAEILINRQGHVISKARIMEHLYGAGADVDEAAIELYVHRLRKKLVGSGTEIKTVRGLGYSFRKLS